MQAPVIKTNAKGERFVLFFGERRPNGVCSNFYKAPFEVDGVKFSCVEQYMMYNKAVTFGDYETAKLILAETEPKKMKAYGRQVRNYDNDVWDKVRYDVVSRGVYEKFKQNPGLRDWIKSAKCDYFVECSPYDDIWGVKLSSDDPRALDVGAWRGTNLLGKALKEAQGKICSA